MNTTTMTMNQMTINESKSIRQKTAISTWYNSNQHGATRNGMGIIQAVGGFGKTYMTVNFLLLPYLMSELVKDKNIVVMVGQEPLVKQWIDEIENFIPAKFHHRVRVATIHEIVNNGVVIHCGLLVADEIHLMYGPKFSKAIDGTLIKFERNLGLSATPVDKEGLYYSHETMWPIIDTISKKEALANGWISNVIEYNWPLLLPNEDIEEYNKLSDYIDRMHEKFGGFDDIKRCAYGEKGPLGFIPAAHYINQIALQNNWSPMSFDDTYNPATIKNECEGYFRAVQRRKSLLNDNPAKIRAALQVFKKFSHLPTMSFCQSTTFCDNLTARLKKEGIHAVCFHSNIESQPMVDDKGKIITYQTGQKAGQVKLFGKTVLKRYVIDEIKSGRSKALVTASSFDTGFDVKTIRVGLICSRTSDYNKQEQRGFRVSRIDNYNPEALCAVVNIYFVNTQDEKWLTKSQVNSGKVTYISGVDDINIEDYDVGFEL